MKGVTFGNYHSYNDLNLILVSKEIGSPEVKVKKVEIEGADSALDFTDYFGEPKYNDLTHVFTFSTVVPQSEFPSLFSRVKNLIHGKRQRVILDDDPSFFYMGRCFVSSFTNEKNIGMITIEAECEPYKYKLEKTVVSQAITESGTVILKNSKKRAVPAVQIDTESSLRLVFGQVNIWDLTSGVYTLPELELIEGENTVEVTGTGTVSFAWQEGEL